MRGQQPGQGGVVGMHHRILCHYHREPPQELRGIVLQKVQRNPVGARQFSGRIRGRTRARTNSFIMGYISFLRTEWKFTRQNMSIRSEEHIYLPSTL